VAHDAAEGLARARTFRPELVSCDIGLPEMDGFAVARAFRADDRLRDVHLVAVSPHSALRSGP
jgi:two-component system CheB/CheR fusion protein